MDEAGTKWFDELKAHKTVCRKRRPLPLRDNLTPAEEMQCRIIGGRLISWLQRHGPRLLQERAVLAALRNWEKDPFTVFTSNQAGLVAANEILEEQCRWGRAKITCCNDMRYGKNNPWNWPNIALLGGKMGNLGVDGTMKTFPYLAFWGRKMRYRAEIYPLF